MPLRKFLSLILFLPIIYFSFFTTSCKKNTILKNGGKLSFSTDTLKFDTVFTTLGSVTRSFKIYNNNNKTINLSEIRIKNGSQSFFRMNIDGTPTKKISDIEMAPNDSIYVFVALTINPSKDSLPFIIDDKVIVTLNGIEHDVALQSFGQNAHYIRDSVLNTQTWINDLPYVILGSGALVDTGAILTIQKGCKIYVNASSKLYVAGTLYAYGTKEDSIIFQGNRLDRDYFGYKSYPGEWGGIHFLGSSKQNNLNHVIIRNAGGFDASVYVQPTPNLGGPIVQMNKCKIENSAGYGILAFNTNIELNNCLIHTCGLQNIAIIEGGTYQLNNCTMATYGGLGINHAQQPTVAVLNYRDTSLTGFVGANLNAEFRNCIIYGPLENELFLNKKGTWDYQVSFQNCLIKRQADFSLATTSNLILNTDPQFKDINKWDFHLPTTSPAKGSGLSINKAELQADLDDIIRQSPPTIGCYEAQ